MKITINCTFVVSLFWWGLFCRCCTLWNFLRSRNGTCKFTSSLLFQAWLVTVQAATVGQRLGPLRLCMYGLIHMELFDANTLSKKKNYVRIGVHEAARVNYDFYIGAPGRNGCRTDEVGSVAYMNHDGLTCVANDFKLLC